MGFALLNPSYELFCDTAHLHPPAPITI
jgi:hypothetical protein